MSLIVKPMRYAHSDGHTDLCYDEDGSHLLTCGTDGDVRIWAGLDDDDAVSYRAGDKVNCVVYKNGRFFTAAEDNAIRAHMSKDGNPDGMITRFTSPVTHMCFNKDGSKLLAGASDFAVKYVTVEDCSQCVFTGHEAPILSVAIDPEEEYVASSSCDGTVKVWRISDQSCFKTFNVLQKCSDVSLSKTLCRLLWHPDKGKYLIVPVKTEVHIYDRVTMELLFSLKDDSMKEVVSVLAFSPCGKYLAASCVDGSVVIWHFESRECIQRQKHSKGLQICALSWNPKGNNEIAFCDTEGQLGAMENVIPEGHTPSNNTTSSVLANQYADLFDEDDDDDMLVQASNQGESKQADDSDDDMPTITPKRRTLRLDDDNSMDVDSVSKMTESDILDDLERDDAESERGAATSYTNVQKPVIVKGFEPTPLQPSFQPGSTPIHLSNRFMVWNAVGIVRQYNTEEENSIDIEFHDTATHHAMHVNNTLNHTIADISSQAVVLACKSDLDTPSKIVCMHFSSWDSNKEWVAPMPDGEDIKAITLGEDWVAVGTDKRNIRLFSIGGIQREIFSVPGPVVTMAAHTNQLLVVYHKGMGIPGDQNLGINLIQVTERKKFIMNGESLPVSVKSTLTWIGFSDEGTPFSYDSLGILRMLNRGFGPSWVEVCNTRKHCKGKSDHYWIVGVRENPQQLRCIPCKGSRFPATLPRPAVALLPFQVPLCDIATDKGQLEETFWRTRLFSGHFDFWSSQGYEFDEADKKRVSMPEQESLMKLFALACKTQREFRAVELCGMMPSSHTMQLAIKYASRLKMLSLAQRISDLARERAAEELAKTQSMLMEREEEEEEDYSAEIKAGYNHVETEWAQRKVSHVEKRPAQEESEEVDVDEEDDVEVTKSSGPMLQIKQKANTTPRAELPSSQTRKNPFKVGAQTDKQTPTSIRGSSVFDSLKKNTANKLTDQKATKEKTAAKKTSTQAKIFSSKPKAEVDDEAVENTPTPEPKKAKSGFQLWKEEHMDELTGEHPDLSESDLTVSAARLFKQLSKEEQKKWSEKAKALVNHEEDSESKKRKRDEENAQSKLQGAKDTLKDASSGNIAKKKKPLSQSTNAKLSGFSFAKKDD